jgi:hypothetical protein
MINHILKKSIIFIIFILIVSSILLVNVSRLNISSANSFSTEYIWIDADANLGYLHLNNGFLHGRDENSPDINETLVNALNPEEWRLYKANSYALAERHQANITYGLSNHYAWNQGGFPEADPWENWTYYEEFILYNMQVYDNYFPDYPVQYYDIWNEPDHPYFWHGTYNQLLELFYRAYNVIKSYNPEVKVVGPSISWYRPGYPGVIGIINFLVDLDSIYGVRLDAISWHENGGTYADTKPEDIPYRANHLRSQIQANFPSDYNPELHVNEYMGSQVHLSPGWNVGFLRYLEEANVDKAMRACWNTYSVDPYDYCSDCWYGLNGMFMCDGQTPQRAYWVQHTHSKMEGETKLDVIESNENTNAIATRNDLTSQIHLLIGRYFKTVAGDVTIQITDYLFNQDNVYVLIECIPNDPTFYESPPQSIPMPDGPNHISYGLFPVVNDEIEITLDNYQDGDAYIITIYPEKNFITNLSNGWNFISTPFNQTVEISNLTINYMGNDYTWIEATNPYHGPLVDPNVYDWNRNLDMYNPVSLLDSGFGYWIYSYVDCELWIENISTFSEDSITELVQTWNIIGIPNVESINKTDLIVNYLGIDYTWAEATNPANGPIVDPNVYGWDRVNSMYIPVGNTLDPGYAYWMYAYEDCILKKIE